MPASNFSRLRAAASSSEYSEMKGLREVGRKAAFCERPSLCGLWPSVKDSHVTPKFWMDDAWLTDRQQAASEAVSALRRPSGRPTARSAPRTTRCVWRWTR
eukprot:scaffold141854_cov23-Tisochrysis_lutea.AAC.2